MKEANTTMKSQERENLVIRPHCLLRLCLLHLFKHDICKLSS